MAPKTENQNCQSCGKPISGPEDFGTNADGNKNDDYCVYCFKGGNFVNPNITMEQMIDIAAVLMAALMNITEKDAKGKAKIAIPKLKRWQK